jgi:hypothetical protein
MNFRSEHPTAARAAEQGTAHPSAKTLAQELRYGPGRWHRGFDSSRSAHWLRTTNLMHSNPLSHGESIPANPGRYGHAANAISCATLEGGSPEPIKASLPSAAARGDRSMRHLGNPISKGRERVSQVQGRSRRCRRSEATGPPTKQSHTSATCGLERNRSRGHAARGVI